MIVISDTTPIITLLKLQRLNLLQKLFGKVMIPAAVFDELTTNAEYSAESKVICECSFLQRQSISNLQSIKILREIVGLDAGESEAIALADEISADLLIIDELKGRKVAKKLGIKITGTIGVLLQAFDEALISRAEMLGCVEYLKNSNIRISDNLLTIILEHINSTIS